MSARDYDANPVYELLFSLVGSDINFSDIHIEQDRQVMLRMPTGWVEAKNVEPVTQADIRSFFAQLDPNWEASVEAGALSCAKDLFSCRLRFNGFTTLGKTHFALNVRRQPIRPIPLENTGLPSYMRSQACNPNGLILVTGQTGSGKTTSLAALVDRINHTRSAHVITIEDPIEFVHERQKSLISMKEVGIDTPSFAQGLRDSLRQKPDVILVGEIRDRDTAETVFAAAESGHLVLASMHTNSVLGAVNKLLSWFPEETLHRARMLANCLQSVVAQTLIPSANGQQRVLATEILINMDQQVADLLADPSKHAALGEYMRQSRDKMSHTLNSSIQRLIQEEKVTSKEAMNYTNDRLGLMELLRPRSGG